MLLLPLEDDGLTGDDITLVYETHSLIGYTMKEEIVSPDHTKPNRLRRSAVVLVQFVVKARSKVPHRLRRRHSDRLSTPPPPVAADVFAVSVVVSCRCHIVYIGGGGRGHEFVVVSLQSSRRMTHRARERYILRTMNL